MELNDGDKLINDIKEMSNNLLIGAINDNNIDLIKKITSSIVVDLTLVFKYAYENNLFKLIDFVLKGKYNFDNTSSYFLSKVICDDYKINGLNKTKTEDMFNHYNDPFLYHYTYFEICNKKDIDGMNILNEVGFHMSRITVKSIIHILENTPKQFHKCLKRDSRSRYRKAKTIIATKNNNIEMVKNGSTYYVTLKAVEVAIKLRHIELIRYYVSIHGLYVIQAINKYYKKEKIDLNFIDRLLSDKDERLIAMQDVIVDGFYNNDKNIIKYTNKQFRSTQIFDGLATKLIKIKKTSANDYLINNFLSTNNINKLFEYAYDCKCIKLMKEIIIRTKFNATIFDNFIDVVNAGKRKEILKTIVDYSESMPLINKIWKIDNIKNKILLNDMPLWYGCNTLKIKHFVEKYPKKNTVMELKQYADKLKMNANMDILWITKNHKLMNVQNKKLIMTLLLSIKVTGIAANQVVPKYIKCMIINMILFC